MRRGLILGLGAACVFVVVAAIMLRLMPGPLRESDYLVIGSVATLVSLLVLFLALVSTSVFYGRTTDKVRVFCKRADSRFIRLAPMPHGALAQA
jgi:hypothetical protein